MIGKLDTEKNYLNVKFGCIYLYLLSNMAGLQNKINNVSFSLKLYFSFYYFILHFKVIGFINFYFENLVLFNNNPRDKRERDLLKAGICDIFPSRFHCVQLEYTTNKQTFVFRIHRIRITKPSKKTKFIKCMFYAKR